MLPTGEQKREQEFDKLPLVYQRSEVGNCKEAKVIVTRARRECE